MQRALFARAPVTSLKVSRKTPSLRQIRDVGSNNFDNLGGVRLTPLPDSGAFPPLPPVPLLRHFYPLWAITDLHGKSMKQTNAEFGATTVRSLITRSKYVLCGKLWDRTALQRKQHFFVNFGTLVWLWEFLKWAESGAASVICEIWNARKWRSPRPTRFLIDLISILKGIEPLSNECQGIIQVLEAKSDDITTLLPTPNVDDN